MGEQESLLDYREGRRCLPSPKSPDPSLYIGCQREFPPSPAKWQERDAVCVRSAVPSSYRQRFDIRNRSTLLRE